MKRIMAIPLNRNIRLKISSLNVCPRKVCTHTPSAPKSRQGIAQNIPSNLFLIIHYHPAYNIITIKGNIHHGMPQSYSFEYTIYEIRCRLNH